MSEQEKSPRTFLLGLLIGGIGATAAFIFKSKYWNLVKKDLLAKYSKVSSAAQSYVAAELEKRKPKQKAQSRRKKK